MAIELLDGFGFDMPPNRKQTEHGVIVIFPKPQIIFDSETEKFLKSVSDDIDPEAAEKIRRNLLSKPGISIDEAMKTTAAAEPLTYTDS